MNESQISKILIENSLSKSRRDHDISLSEELKVPQRNYKLYKYRFVIIGLLCALQTADIITMISIAPITSLIAY